MHERLEPLGEADVSRVHHDELVAEPVAQRERVPLGPRHDGRAVGPVRDDDRLRRVGALAFDQHSAHCLAERYHPVGLPGQEAVHAQEDPVHRLAVEVFEQAGGLGVDVLVRHHERHPEASGGEQAREAKDGRVGQRHDDVGAVEPEPGVAGREEVAHVVREPADEAPLRDAGAARTEDVDAAVALALDQPAHPRAVVVRREERHSRHHRDAAAVRPHQPLAELGEELPGGGGVRVERAVKEGNVHLSPCLANQDREVSVNFSPQRKRAFLGETFKSENNSSGKEGKDPPQLDVAARERI